jgi:hypothetical protein
VPAATILPDPVSTPVPTVALKATSALSPTLASFNTAPWPTITRAPTELAWIVALSPTWVSLPTTTGPTSPRRTTPGHTEASARSRRRPAYSPG